MSEMYKVGIHLVAVNGVSGVLNSVASQLLGINKHVLDFNKSAGILGKTLTGAFAFAGGAATLAFMKTAVDRAKDLQHVQQKMLIGGVIPEHVAEATTKALAVSQQFGQKWVDVLETMNEIRNPLGGIEKSMEHIGQLGAAMTVLRGVDSKTPYQCRRRCLQPRAICGIPECDKRPGVRQCDQPNGASGGGNIGPRQSGRILSVFKIRARRIAWAERQIPLQLRPGIGAGV